MLQMEEKIFKTENMYPENMYSELTIHFQPIFRAQNGKIFGYEALTRHSSKSINIKQLFDEAKKDGSIFLLDMICRKNAIKKASTLAIKDYLFINVCPEILLKPQHTVGITDRLIEEFSFPKNQIILEITEKSAIENYNIFMASVFYYKQRGYKIAIDDFGAGFGGPKMLSLIEPEIVKIDRHFVSNLRKNSICKSFIEFTVSVCHNKNIMVVAEGVETHCQLEELIKLGVDFLQGFYLGEPSQDIKKQS